VKTLGSDQFDSDPIKKLAFRQLRFDGKSRLSIYEQGVKARDVWQEYAPTWQIEKVEESPIVLSAFSSLLASSLARKEAHGPKETAWRRAERTLMFKVKDLHHDNIAWYRVATKRYGEDTVPGALIRTMVPTSYRPESNVGKAVISNAIAANGIIHADAAADHARTLTWLQLTPGAPAFVVVLADSPDGHLTLNNQIAGLHKLKCIGRNSRGEGEESNVVEVTVPAQAAA